MNHVGYAGRRAEQFRFEGDTREITLEMSDQTARAIIALITVTDDVINPESPLLEVRQVLRDLLQQ